MIERCPWAGSDPKMIAYHDDEWGVPTHGERELFELLVLEGAQAGLSWSTILNKRDGYRRAFRDFEPGRVARFNRRSVGRLLADPGIVRNRRKVESAIRNARAVLELQRECGSFDAYLWSFVDGTPRIGGWRDMSEVPATTEISDAMSGDLARRGFSFVGSTICYALMQSAGLVDDHLSTCPRGRARRRSRSMETRRAESP